jgi:hypothetical protein
LCIEPLIQAITKECGEFGAQIGPTGEQLQLAIQAYANDAIFISDNRNRVTKMLEVLKDFVDWSKMEVNVKKCATASYLKDMDRHRCILASNLNFKGQPISNLMLAQSLKYLGTAIAPRRTVRLEATEVNAHWYNPFNQKKLSGHVLMGVSCSVCLEDLKQLIVRSDKREDLMVALAWAGAERTRLE